MGQREGRVYVNVPPLWNKRDLEEKLKKFLDYYNAHRDHQALG